MTAWLWLPLVLPPALIVVLLLLAALERGLAVPPRPRRVRGTTPTGHRPAAIDAARRAA
ncbi:MAG TPA: hypothetical protein VK935_24060 [Actinomycetospora sp.]|nr:hypothetical protein [Actinomycetospora sp.]